LINNNFGIKPETAEDKLMSAKKVFNHPDWEIYWPKPVTWIGFLIALALVIMIMVGTMLIARIGA
jgi:hypothetical protein